MWRSLLAAAAAIAWLGRVASADAATLQLDAVADTFVNSDSPTMNFGNFTFAEVGTLGPPKFAVERALLSFDLSTIPNGTPITRARLQFVITGAVPDPPNFSATVARLASGFDENTVTWDTQPAIVPAPIATALITAPVASTMEIDVTQLIQAQLASAAPDAVSLRIAKTDEGFSLDDLYFDLATKEAMPAQPAVLLIDVSATMAPALAPPLVALSLVVLAAIGTLALRRRRT